MDHAADESEHRAPQLLHAVRGQSARGAVNGLLGARAVRGRPAIRGPQRHFLTGISAAMALLALLPSVTACSTTLPSAAAAPRPEQLYVYPGNPLFAAAAALRDR